MSRGVDVQMYGDLAAALDYRLSRDKGGITPQARRSFTRRTLDMTSRPMSSNTRTFHIGSPVSERIGAFAGSSPLAFGSPWASAGCVGELRFRMRSMEAAGGRGGVSVVQEQITIVGREGAIVSWSGLNCTALTYLAIAKCSHGGTLEWLAPAGVQATSYVHAHFGTDGRRRRRARVV